MNQALQHEHLDPDQLNAFAEGVLPEHERLMAMAHLAECPSCREVAFLAQEALAAEAPAIATADEPARAPFWKRWFGPLPLAGAAALACAAVAFVMWRTPPTVQTPQNQVATVKQEQPPILPAPPTVKTEEPRVLGHAEMKAPASPAKAGPARSTEQSAAASGAAATSAITSDSMTADRATPAPVMDSTRDLGRMPLSKPEGINPPVTAPAVAAAPAPPPPAMQKVVPSIPPATPQTPVVAAGTPANDQLRIAGRDVNAQPSAVSRTLDSKDRRAFRAVTRTEESGSITGTVTDRSGASIPGVHITARADEKSPAKSAITDVAGRFSLNGLPAGHYKIDFAAPGFQPQTQNIEIQSRQLAQLDSKLAVGGASQTVTVAAGAPPMELESSSIGNLAKRTSIPCDEPLPSGKPHTYCQLSGEEALAADGNGSVFLRKANNHWRVVKVPWTSSIKSLGLRGRQFEIVTADGIAWLSSDGLHWNRQPAQ